MGLSNIPEATSQKYYPDHREADMRASVLRLRRRSLGPESTASGDPYLFPDTPATISK